MAEPWTREDQPFNYSATGFLGRKRCAMLNNHLLQRCPLGRARGSTCPQYPEDVVYGDNFRNPLTVAHAMRGWDGLIKQRQQQTHKSLLELLPNDFQQYNVGALSMGIVKKEEVCAYRKTRTHLPMLNYGPPSEKIVRPPPVKTDPNTVYGRKTVRQPESMSDLVAHVYHKQYFLQARPDRHQEITIRPPDLSKIRSTNAAQLRHITIGTRSSKIPVCRRHLPQVLAKVKSKLSTFRSESDRQQAAQKQTRRPTEGGDDLEVPVISKKERLLLPRYMALPSIKDYHLCPPHGPLVEEEGLRRDTSA